MYLNKPCLAIDTSGKETFVAVSNLQNSAEVKIFARASGEVNSHYETIEDLCSKLLLEANLKLSDLGSIVFVCGPGSFTGLRIGLSFIIGLAFSLNIPVLRISSLYALSFTYRHLSKKIIAISDARRDEVFFEELDFSDNNNSEHDHKWVGAAEIISYENLAKKILPYENFEILTSAKSSDFKLPENLGLTLKYENINLAEQALEILINSSLQEDEIYELERLSSLEPFYLREVAAKKQFENVA